MMRDFGILGFPSRLRCTLRSAAQTGRQSIYGAWKAHSHGSRSHSSESRMTAFSHSHILHLFVPPRPSGDAKRHERAHRSPPIGNRARMTTNNVRYVMPPYIDTGRITSCRTQRAGEIFRRLYRHYKNKLRYLTPFPNYFT